MLSKDSYVVELLKRAPLFDGVSERDLRRIGEWVDVQNFREGNLVMLEDHHGEQFLIILDGSVDIERDGEHVATVDAGSFLGEAGLLSGADRNATVTANCRVRVLTMSQADFREMRSLSPLVAGRIDAESARRRPS